jgi:hypothetical protein
MFAAFAVDERRCVGGTATDVTAHSSSADGGNGSPAATPAVRLIDVPESAEFEPAGL